MLVPLIERSVWQFALGFAVASFVMAAVLAVVFQLAHCIEEADFTTVAGLASAGRVEWASTRRGRPSTSRRATPC